MKYVEIIKILKDNNFRLKRQAKGSHELWSDGKVIIVVPNHGSKELKKGISESILRKAGIK